MQVRRGVSPSAYLHEVWDMRIRRDYAGGPSEDVPFELIPAIALTYGGWHFRFATWLRRTARATAELQRGPLVRHVHTQLLWRTVGILSTQLQRASFASLANCIVPLQADIRGRLGHELSEAPEHWRAAPASAVGWVALELSHQEEEIAPSASSPRAFV